MFLVSTKKQLGQTQRLFAIARLRDTATKNNLSYDLTDGSILFDGHLDYPDKATLTPLIEQNLNESH